ncbi:winged helix-turn-helix transcriptional regulator [Cloacibacillus porcorum]
MYRQADKKPIKKDRQELIFAYVRENGSISNKEAREILCLAESTTKRILNRMVQDGTLTVRGERKARVYVSAIEV